MVLGLKWKPRIALFYDIMMLEMVIGALNMKCSCTTDELIFLIPP
jgi:hypothetical protein